MLAERYLRRRHAEGKKEGREEANAKWREWYNRLLEAKAEDKPFDEPPPSEE
jgi:hypothetical protein